MKQMTCEMCGSTDIMKQDGVFVCQSCGMKYSVEEAKKMITEGTDNVDGTVPVDNSASYDRIIQLARDAYADKRFDSAYDYYCQAVEIRPDVVENVLRQGLSILAKEPIESGIPLACSNIISRAISLIKDMNPGKEKNDTIFSAINDLRAACSASKTYFDEEIKNLNRQRMDPRSPSDIIADMAKPASVSLQHQAEDQKIKQHNLRIDVAIMNREGRKSKIDDFHNKTKSTLLGHVDVNSRFKYYFSNDLSKAVELYPKITLSAKEQKALARRNNRKLFDAVSDKNVEQVEMLIAMGADVNEEGSLHYQNEYHYISPLFAVTAFKCTAETRNAAVKIVKLLLENGAKINGDECAGTRTLLNTDTAEEIKKLIIEKAPDMQNKVTEAPKERGCYVATAVYGSYDCPQVWTLRRYRDYTLAETWYGRLFIMLYYSISPTLVKWFGSTTWFKKMWKGKLDRMVAELQEKGVESTPYEDRNW